MPGTSSLKVAVICSSNMNRSMEAHAFLSKKGFHVRSYGTGDKVKLPGPAPDKPNCYEFGITYDEIYQDLLNSYTQNGLLHMLDRNKRIKPRPERFQTAKEKFDILVTCEERVYDQVIEALESRTPTDNASVHVINIDIQDNHEEATLGAFLICELMTMVSETMVSDASQMVHLLKLTSISQNMSQSEDLDNDIDELLHDFEAKCQRPILHCVLFY
ncbi:RNA polymerase II subunit A C-terminal domain phosphatase SSU72 [Blattella germanica]|nr:RNA polymerase II subunit A C-terminal domain phosphatase SSU72 [Blattella germanica]